MTELTELRVYVSHFAMFFICHVFLLFLPAIFFCVKYTFSIHFHSCHFFFFFFVIFLEVTLSVKINILTDKNLGQINSSLIAVIYKIFASVYLILPSVLHAVIIWKLYISV